MHKKNVRFLLLVMFILCALAPGKTALAQTLRLNGDAINISPGCYQLTDSMITNQISAIWVEDSLDLNQGFDLTFYTYFQDVGMWGGDGIAFVLHRDPAKWAAIGPAGNALGFANSVPVSTPGISPSFAVEIDIWDNTGAGVDDTLPDHISLIRNGNLLSTVQGIIRTALPGGANVTTGECRPLRIRWTPSTDSLVVWFNGNRVISVQENIRTGFGGQPVYFGITSSSGGVTMFQAICFDFITTIADSAICSSDTLNLSTNGGLAYSWMPAANLSSGNIPNPTFYPPSSGNYQLVVNGNNFLGCMDWDTLNIAVGQQPLADAGASANLCLGDSLLIGTPSLAGIAYSWTPATDLDNATIAQPTASPSANVQYLLTVSDTSTSANCSAIDSTVITVLPSPISDAGRDTVICTGDSVVLNGAGGGTYNWLTAAGLSSTSISNPTFNPAGPGVYPIVLEVTLGASCADSDTVVVNVGLSPLADAGGPQAICIGDSIQVGGMGLPGLIYTWTPVSGLSNIGIAQPMANPPVSTQYMLMVTDPTTAATCSSLDSMLLTVNPFPLALAGPDTILCGNDSAFLGVAGIPGLNYAWSPPSGLNFPNISNPQASPSAPTTYLLIVTDPATTCSTSDSVTVSLDPVSPAFAGLDSSLCGTDINLYATSPVLGSGTWTDPSGNVFITSPNLASSYASGLVQGPNLLVWTVANLNCSSTDTVVLITDVLTSAMAGPDTTICLGDLQLYASSPVMGTGMWTGPSVAVFSPADSANALATNLPMGTDTLYWTVSNGTCADIDQLIVTVIAPPTVANAGPDQLLSSSGNILMAGNIPAVGTAYWQQISGTTVTFDNINNNQTGVQFPQAGGYVFQWIIANPPCPDSRDQMQVTVNDFSIPSAFSPNNDGKNDIFVIRGLENHQNSKLLVFNRWGNLVYQSTNYLNDWNGANMNGRALSDDTYFYVLKLSNKAVFQGFIIVKR